MSVCVAVAWFHSSSGMRYYGQWFDESCTGIEAVSACHKAAAAAAALTIGNRKPKDRSE